MSADHTRQAVLDHVFTMITDAAVAGERCPMASEIEYSLSRAGLPYSGGGAAVPKLARAGKLHIAVFMHNYRVVTICDGPHKGKKTNPPRDGLRPYLVITSEGETLRPKRHDDAQRRAL